MDVRRDLSSVDIGRKSHSLQRREVLWAGLSTVTGEGGTLIITFESSSNAPSIPSCIPALTRPCLHMQLSQKCLALTTLFLSSQHALLRA